MSVVVATRDRAAALGEALRAVRAAMADQDELIVVDSASTDPAVAAVARDLGATVVRSALPGACRARNLGWRAARHHLVAFTDDDCLPGEQWLARIAGAFAGAPDAAFLTGRVLPAPDGETGAPRRLAGRAQLSVSLQLDDRARPITAPEEADGAGHGANMAWRRPALDTLGGFDEALGPGAPLRAGEDADLLWRALRHGMAGIYEPAATVFHRQWRSRRRQLAAYYAYGIGEGAVSVKRLRIGGGRVSGGRLVADVLGRGLPAAARRLASGYEMGALADLVRAAGAVRGGLRARRRGLSEGHFTG